MKYDLIIAGGGTAGCACAYTAGKLGLKTLLIEKNSFLGGTMTSSLVTPAMSSGTNNLINFEFYKELMAELNLIGGQITYADGNIGWFNPELLKIVLDRMMDKSNVDVILNSSIDEIVITKGHIKGVYLDKLSHKSLLYSDTIYTDNNIKENKMLSEYIETNYLVDGTGDAKIFEKLNLKFLNNLDNFSEKKYQPINLRFIMSGIDLKTFSEWIMNLDNNRDVTTSCIINDEIHLSTAYTWDNDKDWALEPVFKQGIKDGIITEADSNYFQVFSIPGMQSSLAFNCPRLMINSEFNPEDSIIKSKLLKQGRESIFRLSNFFKKYFKGFENAYISSIANSLGIRVSNRINGKYVYSIDDLRTGKIFDNPVLISKYPVDIHSLNKNTSVLEKQEQEYMLPIESLMSKEYDNLFAIGRCISADFESQAALRIIPSCFAMGEGLAKHLAKTK